MKSNRQKKILEIIAERDIETQNQLMEALLAAGVKSTQATVSRDIKELRLVKELSPERRYRYVAAGGDEVADYDIRLKKIFRESVTECNTAQNLVIIRTLPGLAQGAASALDGMSVSELVGTIAGDDTIMVAMKTGEAAEEFLHQVRAMMG